ncbi:MAG: pyruvate kinase [Bacteroidota bacterium]
MKDLMKEQKRSKIVATVGPASNDKETLIELVHAGVDVFRLNFSHGSHDDHKKVIEYVREINEELNTNVCLLQDLQGPKIRIGKIKGEKVEIREGEELIITNEEEILGDATKVSTTYKAMPEDVSKGDTILVDDGKIELRVKGVKGHEVTTEVIYGGWLKSKKGINLPNTKISAPSLTEKDRKDLIFGIENEVEWIALSFVRRAEDIIDIKTTIKESGKDIRVVAKIEKPEALTNIDQIVAETDGLMVARGDLGVEIKMEDVPMVQKELVSKCNQANKPVIIATQMLESMIENPRPTRAETNDIANAVLDGADALMLSAETAAGKFPIESVTSMAKTIASTENHNLVFDKYYDLDEASENFNSDNLVATACKLSNQIKAKAIIGMTKSGYTGIKISGHRPKSKIFIFTPNKRLLKTLNLYWGVQGFYYDELKSTDSTFSDVEGVLRSKDYLQTGDVFVTMASMPIHWKGRTNMFKINVTQ